MQADVAPYTVAVVGAAATMTTTASPEEVFAALSSTLVVDLATRRAAEAAVESLSARPGFAAALVQLTLAPTLALEIRQLAAVLLKRFVRTHWSDEAENFAPPAVHADDKAAFRAALPAGLHDPVPRAHGGRDGGRGDRKHDFPDEWPSLMGERSSRSRSPPPARRAWRRPTTRRRRAPLLELCVGELDEGQLLAALELLPLLLALYGGAGQPLRVRARVRVLHRLLAQLTALCDSRKTLAAVRRSCAGWVTALLASLASAAEPAAAASFAAVDCSLQVAELRLLRLLVHSMPKAVEAQAAALLPPLGPPLLVAHRAHEREAGAAAADDDDGDGGERACDSDGDMIGGEALASQLFDVFAALAASSKFFRTLGTALPELLHAALGFLQIPPATQREWEADAEAYLWTRTPTPSPSPCVWRAAAARRLIGAVWPLGPPRACGAARRRIDEAASVAPPAPPAGGGRARRRSSLWASRRSAARAAAAASKTPAAAAAAAAAAPPPSVDASSARARSR